MEFEIKDQKGSKLAILQALRMHGSMSRIDLTRLTRLSRATVSTSISELIENKLVYETDNKYMTGGRPATVVELVPHSVIVIGAEYDSLRWTIGAFDLLGNTVLERQIPDDTSNAEEAFRLLARELEPFARQLASSPVPLIGIGVPGLVDQHFRKIRSAPEPGWYNIEVARIMEEETGLSAAVVNRHRARGLAECRYGAGQPYRNMIYIGVGDGIAAGLYVNRQLLSGSLGGAGELGHTTVEPQGPGCPCGNNGCLQVLASSPAIEQNYRRTVRTSGLTGQSADEAGLEWMKGRDIAQAADQGLPAAVSAVRTAAGYMGISMANLLNLFNPEAIILGGSIPSASQLYVEHASATMRQRAMPSLSSETSVSTAALGSIGGALGAANIALDLKASSLALFKV